MQMQSTQLSFDQVYCGQGPNSFSYCLDSRDRDDLPSRYDPRQQKNLSSLNNNQSFGGSYPDSQSVTVTQVDISPIIITKIQQNDDNQSSGGSLNEEAETEDTEGEASEPHNSRSHSHDHHAIQLDTVKQNLNEKWQGIFQFDLTKQFALEAIDKKKINDQVLQSFLTDLNLELTDLTIHDLQLNFDKCWNLSDKGIKHLTTHLKQSFKELRSLHINLHKCDKITNQSLLELGLFISSLQSLESLSLNFYDCNKITDQGVINLTTNIEKSLHSLKTLELNFRLCWKITDLGVQALTQLSFESLEQLSLHFKICAITDAGIESLTNHILAQSKSLQYLFLNFEMCSKITTPRKKMLAESFGFLPEFVLEI